jgi:hypothetical protein
MAEDQTLIAPYLEWAVSTGFAHLDAEWFSVLLDVDAGAARFATEAERSALANRIWVAPAYRAALKGFKEEDFTRFSAILHKGALEALLTPDRSGDLASAIDKLGIKRIEFGTPAGNPFGKGTAGTRTRSAVQPSGVRPSVIVAVIDDGLAFAHERFRGRNGRTRFKYFWNQDDTTGIGQPADFQYGREFSEDDINGLLAAWTGPSGIVDEDALYRQAGQKLVCRRVKHGTHVMDIACGMNPMDVTPQSPYLIGVQLPSRVTERTSGVFLTPAVRDAIHFIMTRADQIADEMNSAPLPIVINVSYGTIAGPHDGNGLLESAIDQLVADRPTPLRVVLPAGNHYLARCHAAFDLPAGASQALRWRVQPDNKASSFMELWLPKQTAGGQRPQVEMRITTPTRESSGWIGPGQHWHWPNDGDVRFRAVNYDPPGRRPRLFLAMAPTADLLPLPRTAPAGTWLVEVRNMGGDVAVEGWIQRGDTPFGYPLWGRQSRFEDPEYKRFDLAGRPWQEDTPSSSYIRRRGSINALATGQRSIVVGGFRRSDRTPSVYSGSGPTSTPVTIPPQRTGPDAAAAADDSPVMQGLLAAGTRTGSVAAMSGSSVAAPQVTRRIAELMGSALPSDRVAVQVGAAAGDPYAPGTNMVLRERLGAGRIDRPGPVALR